MALQLLRILKMPRFFISFIILILFSMGQAQGAPSIGACRILFDFKPPHALTRDPRAPDRRLLLSTAVRRSISSSAEVVGTSSLNYRLKNLNAGDIWFSSGAAHAVAETQFLTFPDYPRTAKVISFDQQRPKTSSLRNLLQDYPNRYQYLSNGKTLEEAYLAGELNHLFGKITLITDIYGPATYTADLSLVFEIYMKLLKPGGVLITNIPAIRPHLDAYTPKQNFMSFTGVPELETRNTFRRWLNGARGIQLIEFNERVGALGENIGIVLTKIGEHVQLIPLITEDYDDAVAPPVRRFVKPLILLE